MNECAVCYVTDLNFMLPTLISAVRIRNFVPANKADIYIFSIDDGDGTTEDISTFLQSFNIHILQINSNKFSGIDWSRTNKTHVPLATMGRFFMDGLLPDSCKRIVYLDGDTWVKRDPSKLIDFKVPEGRFAAVEDISFFCRNDLTSHGHTVRKYFRGLGIDAESGYFNAGVFSVTRKTWRPLANEALKFFMGNTEVCKYHDQSALNAVVGDRRLRLSPAWNFQTPYRYWNVEREIDPVIYHFTQGPKPWNGPVEPWIELFTLYESRISVFAELKLPLERLPGVKIAALNAHSRMYERKLRCLFPFRLRARKEMLRKLVSASVPQTVAA